MQGDQLTKQRKEQYMETILVAVDMAKLENPDTDIRYDLADKLEI